MGERDIAGLLFTAEMYGVQVDHLARVLGVSEPRARAIAAGWRSRRLAESARLGPGTPWIWLTRTGLASCGLVYAAAPPALGRLAHIRAVISVRLALESVAAYAAAGAYWRGERRLRARAGGRVGLREHLPDGVVHVKLISAADPMAQRGRGRLGGRVLGHRDRAHPQDGQPDHRDHAGITDPHG